MLDPRHAPRFEKTPGVAHGLLTLFVGALLGCFGLLGYISLAWGLHWVVACR